MTAVLQIRLFCGLEIRQGDAPIGSFISSEAPALAAYLAVTRRAHQREALAQRVRYRELALHALHTLTEHHLSRGIWSAAQQGISASSPWLAGGWAMKAGRHSSSNGANR